MEFSREELDLLKNRPDKLELAKDMLVRYTGMPISKFKKNILITNFRNYVSMFAEQFDCQVYGEHGQMQAASSADITIINFGIGAPNAGLLMNMLVGIKPKAVLFLGKCGGLKKTSKIGHFILPSAAIRDDGVSDKYLPPLIPALPSFKIHKFASQVLAQNEEEYRTGVVYTTNIRFWEHDSAFLENVLNHRALAIEMETATIFSIGFYNEISRGALLLVSDTPIFKNGVKTIKSDKIVTERWAQKHLDYGIQALMLMEESGEKIKHFKY